MAKFLIRYYITIRDEILGQNSIAQYLNQIAMMYLSEEISTTHFLVDKLQQTLGALFEERNEETMILIVPLKD